ncbi:hypothetical protein OHD26_10755 [Escherichia coli]|nr:hypothetical protein [Escherichia coli]
MILNPLKNALISFKVFNLRRITGGDFCHFIIHLFRAQRLSLNIAQGADIAVDLLAVRCALRLRPLICNAFCHFVFPYCGALMLYARGGV